MKIDDNYFMKQALKVANDAIIKGEVPVGAVIVFNGKVIARAHNQTENLKDVTAHAEILSITSASNFLNSKFLKRCTMYVTLEPCVMCAGASYWSQLKKIVFGASDEKRGFQALSDTIIHPKTEVVGGIMAEECSQILKDFFVSKRQLK